MLLHLLSVSTRICLTVPAFLESSEKVFEIFEEHEIKSEEQQEAEARYKELIKFGEWMVGSTEEKDVTRNTASISILLRNGMLGQLIMYAAQGDLLRKDTVQEDTKTEAAKLSGRNQGSQFEKQMKQDNQAIIRNQGLIMEALKIKVPAELKHPTPTQKVEEEPPLN